ncbi:MAG: glycosyltransferase [Saprospiraceae bacterium]
MIYFVAPPADVHVSGGSLFNGQILRALQQVRYTYQYVSVQRWEQRTFDPGDVIIIDSIYMPALDEMFMDSMLAQKVLLVHLLPSMLSQEDADSEKIFLKKFNRLIVNSKFTKDYCVQKMGFPGKIDILEPYIERSPYIGLETVRNKILLVATWQPVKQIDLFLLLLAKHTLPPDLVIDIYGDASINQDYFQYCLAILERFPELKDHIKIHGIIDHKDLLRLYHQTKMLLDTSSFESYGMAVAEALAAGVMVITLGKGNIKNLLSLGSGILCQNMDEIIHYMLIIHDQELIPRLNSNSSSEARWQKFIEQVKLAVEYQLNG